MARACAIGLCALFACDSGPPICGPDGTIDRVAGTGALGFNGDGLPPLETEFYMVSEVRPTPTGILLMDFNNHRLRAIEDGVVRTIAGNGQHNLATPDVLATESPLENPIDFAERSTGTRVIAPLHDPRLLEIGRDGVLRVIAGGEQGDSGDGGLALEARFVELHAVLVGPDDAIYVSDFGANRVRRIDRSGKIDAFAGDGSASSAGDGGKATEAGVFGPEGLAIGADGSIYVAESLGDRIRRIAPDGTISTVAGSGERGNAGDGGKATEAKLHTPSGVALRADGTLFIADSANHEIRAVDPSGLIRAVAGDGTSGATGDGGPAQGARLFSPSRVVSSECKLWVADLKNSLARVIDFAE